MKTKEIEIRAALGVSLLGALFAIFFVIPQISEAHGGVTHSTAGEAAEHLRETARSNSGTRASTTVDVTCMAEAVGTREDALMTAWSEQNTAMTAALTERKEALVDAWDLSSQSERTRALAAAWKEWKSEKKSIIAEFRKDRKAAWDAFKKTAKDDCREKLPKEEVLEKAASDTIAI